MFVTNGAIHQAPIGSKLKTLIGAAREQVANLIGALPEEILFTSCATESNNAAIQAVLKSNPTKRHCHLGCRTFLGFEPLPGVGKGGLSCHLLAGES
jgi:cysteine sulfinate desulfinase/cysteine desulfurase-like protein